MSVPGLTESLSPATSGFKISSMTLIKSSKKHGVFAVEPWVIFRNRELILEIASYF